jgi:ABC-2 type transport system ATP-binding protein
VTFSAKGGEIFGLLGPNGAGKSTIMKLLTGLIRPTGGSAQLMGYPIGSPRSRERVGFLPENFRFHKWLTGQEVLRFHGALHKLDKKTLEQQIDALLELVRLTQARAKRVKTYSKGMQQRLGIACALLGNPAVVFLDEPSAALDPLGRREVRGILTDLRRQGVTIFLNSHLLGEVEMVCDTVAVMKNSRIIAQGSLESLRTQSRIVEIQIGPFEPPLLQKLRSFGSVSRQEGKILLTLRNPAEVPEVARTIIREGVDLHGLTLRQDSLEDLFVSLMQEAKNPSEGTDT